MYIHTYMGSYRWNGVGRVRSCRHGTYSSLLRKLMFPPEKVNCSVQETKDAYTKSGGSEVQ